MSRGDCSRMPGRRFSSHCLGIFLCSMLRIWRCHCNGLGHYGGLSSIPGQRTSVSAKKKKSTTTTTLLVALDGLEFGNCKDGRSPKASLVEVMLALFWGTGSIGKPGKGKGQTSRELCGALQRIMNDLSSRVQIEATQWVTTKGKGGSYIPGPLEKILFPYHGWDNINGWTWEHCKPQ